MFLPIPRVGLSQGSLPSRYGEGQLPLAKGPMTGFKRKFD